MQAVNRWFKRFIVGFASFAVVLVLLVLAGSHITRRYAARIAERDFPPPGRILEIDGRSAHIYCTGSGSPTILLESGLDDRGSSSWTTIQEDLAQVSRVCAYDRAGILWSEPGADPRDGEAIAEELHALLAAVSEAPPYVLVGHSQGGLLVRVYDQRFPGEAAGFVFIDSSHPEQDDRFPAEVREQIARGGLLSLPPWVFGILAPYWVLVEHDTPDTAYRWRSFPQVMRETAAVDAVSEQAARSLSLGDRPVVVLTAGTARRMSGISDEGNAEMHRTWLELHEELSALSTNSDHRIIEGAGHYIHVDRPEAVVSGIRDVVAAIREGLPVRREGS